MTPIWYIIGEMESVPPNMYGVWRLIEVHATTIEEVMAGKFEQRYGEVHRAGHYRAQTMMVFREVDNPFKDAGVAHE